LQGLLRQDGNQGSDTFEKNADADEKESDGKESTDEFIV
jgi:hypothetical protein